MRLALAGDTMLGRLVARRIEDRGVADLFAREVVEAAHEADLVVLNLECAVSDRGERWPDPRKPFFFRAPPLAVQALAELGVSCVTLANNHALDYGAEALLDTLGHLDAAGIGHVGAGSGLAAARAPVVLEAGGLRLGVLGLTDHPADFAAAEGRPGVAFADLDDSLPAWVAEEIAGLRGRTDLVVVTPHWGPNMTSRPPRHVRRAARALQAAGADLVAGHSAHVFHGVAGAVLFDLGDFIDDYAVDEVLRNDVGLLWLVDLDAAGPVRIEALPLTLELAHTRLATPEDAAWARGRFTEACRELGTDVVVEGERLVVRCR